MQRTEGMRLSAMKYRNTAAEVPISIPSAQKH